MGKRRTSQAWDLYDVLTDFEGELEALGMVRERMCEDVEFDENHHIKYVRHDKILWDVLMEYFEHDFDMDGAMKALCEQYGIDNPYEEA